MGRCAAACASDTQRCTHVEDRVTAACQAFGQGNVARLLNGVKFSVKHYLVESRSHLPGGQTAVLFTLVAQCLGPGNGKCLVIGSSRDAESGRLTE